MGFEEPYIKDFAAGSVDAWLGAAGFEAVQTQELWWVHQVTKGMKPLPVDKPTTSGDQATTSSIIEDLDSQGIPAPAF